MFDTWLLYPLAVRTEDALQKNATFNRHLKYFTHLCCDLSRLELESAGTRHSKDFASFLKVVFVYAY
ncbi:MAG: hypothetical protein LBN74_08530 [Prevotella sp.]|jgi:hypothetical protein|nr:hypothetical protein [Prevotella sp.]